METKERPNRQWHTNTHKQTIVLDRKKVQANVCTRCLRTMNKPIS